ncbi:MAG: glycosyltransferase WbuB [Acidobacteriaceae bacterium]|nr:glycosyltransferase WbuB [Acidobacteriaceae bacterium]
MRILIYGLNYAPEMTGIGKYTGEMAEWLAERGHEVRVVTAPPYYPAWKIREDYRGQWFRKESAPGRPTVFRVPLWVPEKPTGMKRLLHLASFACGSLPVALAQTLWEPQVVFTVEPTFFSAPFAAAVARLSGAKSWLHVQDFEVDAAFELGLLPSDGPIHKIATGLEALFTRAFDAVSSISQKMVERSLSKGVSAEKTVLFPNWVDIDLVHPMSSDTTFRRDLGLEEKVVVLYSGNMGGKQGLEMLAPLARACSTNPSLHFLFCGDGAFRPQLEEQVQGLANVTLLPLQPLAKLNALLNTADIHLLPQRAGAADLVMPSKLTGMLSSGRPVIATVDHGTQVAMVVEGRGLVVPPENLEALTQAVLQLAADESLRRSMGEAARAYAVDYLGTESVLRQFERDLETVVYGDRNLR